MIKRIFFFLIVFFFVSPFPVRADQLPEEKVIEGKVTQVVEEKIIDEKGSSFFQKSLEVETASGEKINLALEENLIPGQVEPKKGDRVLLSLTKDSQGNQAYYLTDFVRRQPLLLLFCFFLFFSVVVGGLQGVGSLFGLMVSFFIIALFLVPQIALGRNPVLVTVAASLIIVPATFYLSHGFNRKTTVAIGGTMIALLFSGFLAQLMINGAKLTGLVAEEVGFLQSIKPGQFNFQGLLLSGMLIALLGVLDDVTVSQAAIVQQLKEANPRFSSSQLFFRAMKVGRDHIASMVNTLLLVYVGAALPLLLLFYQSPHPFLEMINYEIISEEIIRALVGSIGLILAVPITTFLAAEVIKRKEKNS